MIRARLIGAFLLSLVLASLTLLMVTAQDNTPPLLTLTSPDSTHPVQFQILAWDESPTRAGFSSQANVPVETQDVRVYVAVINTGWSEGVIGLSSDKLSPQEQYVALEVDETGAPIKGGQAFELVYQEDAGGQGMFVLQVLIAQQRTFAVFQVAASGGVTVEGQTAVQEEDVVLQNPVEHQIDPQSPFGNLVLECHIIARSSPAQAQPGENNTASTWGQCGGCETCGHPGECLLDPGGQCVWDPGTCHWVGAAPGSLPTPTSEFTPSPSLTPLPKPS